MDFSSIFTTKKGRISLVIFVVLFFVLIIYLLIPKNKPIDYPVSEADGPGIPLINNTESLRQILLSNQYTVVSDELINFIQGKLGSQSGSGYIVGQPKIASNGSVSFTVRYGDPVVEFTVVLDRNTYFDKVIFSVPSYSYESVLKVYGKGED